MRELFLRCIATSILCCLAVPGVMQAQSDGATIYKKKCALCHGADGSGDTGPGKALHAKDLRSEVIQKQTDAELAGVIAKGKGKMPAFAAKIKPDDVKKLVAYLRELSKQK